MWVGSVRLAELDGESDIERLLAAPPRWRRPGLTLGVTVSRRRLLPAVMLPILLQHAVQGWCPRVSLFRRLDVRTCIEIDAERYALKILRGYFRDVRRWCGRRPACGAGTAAACRAAAGATASCQAG